MKNCRCTGGMLEDVHSNGWQAAIKPIHAVRIVGEGFDQAGNERTPAA